MPVIYTSADPYVQGLFDALGERDPLDVLAETPVTLRKAISNLTPDQDAKPEAPGKWSVRQLVQHLADSELTGGFRFRMVLAHDAPALPGYDQNVWVENLRYHEADVAMALDDFATLRASNLRLFRRATPEELHRVMLHSERGRESLGQMISMYAGHDIKHLGQLERIKRAIGVSA